MSENRIKKTETVKKSDQESAIKNPVNVLFGRKLAELRKKHNLQQEECAEKLDVHAQTISRYERGEISPNLAFVVKAAEFFKVNIGSFTSQDSVLDRIIRIPVLGKPDQYCIFDINILKALTPKENLKAYIADNNHMFPSIQKGDIVLISEEYGITLDQIVVIQYQSQYIIKRVCGVSGINIQLTSNDSTIKQITVTPDSIIGKAEAYLRGNL